MTDERRLHRWGSQPVRGSNLGALYTADHMLGPPVAWRDYRTAVSADGHSCGVDWPEPIDISEIVVHWAPGFEPTDARVYALTATDDDRLLAPETLEQGATRVRDVGRILGFRIEQAPDGGSASAPREMRIRGVCVLPRSTRLEVRRVSSDGVAEGPTTPCATDGFCNTWLDVGFAGAVRFAGDFSEARSLRIAFVQLGRKGSPSELRDAFSNDDRLRVLRDGEWTDTEFRFAIEPEHVGLTAGSTTFVVGLDHLDPGFDAVEIAVPGDRERMLAIRNVETTEAVVTAPTPLSPRPPERSSVDISLDEFTVSEVREQLESPVHACALGLPGTDERAGVAADGTILLRPGTRALRDRSAGQSCSIALGLRVGDNAPARLGATLPRRDWHAQSGSLTLSWHGPDAEVELELAPLLAKNGPVLRGRLSIAAADANVRVGIGASIFDFWAPLDCHFTRMGTHQRTEIRTKRGGAWVVVDDDWAVRHAHMETQLWSPPVLANTERVVPLVIPLTRSPSVADAFDVTIHQARLLYASHAAEQIGVHRAKLPTAEWQDILDGMWAQAALFFRADACVPYGLFPSVYDGDIFGLEEDYLFYGLACWGAVDPAIRAFRRTYLNAGHLRKDHYLHDLRNGLTPWQLERLLAHADQLPELSPEEVALLDDCADWITRERAKTGAATGEAPEGGQRVFPGLLPPFRYGGDLGFKTQSITANAANLVGVRALAELLPSRMVELDEEAHDFAESLQDALERLSVSTPNGLHVPMHTGPDDDGSYYQLMSCGILQPLDPLPADSPFLEAIDARLQREGRLFLELPRFDEWGSYGKGIDAHYAVGYLLRQLRLGHQERFWRGLVGMIGATMDPDVMTFREVAPLPTRPIPWGTGTHMPGRSLARSEPCVGSVGVVLQLIRHAFATETYAEDGSPSRRQVLLMAGVLPDWWRAGFEIGPVPTFAGDVRLIGRREGSMFALEYETFDAVEVFAQIPDIRGLQWEFRDMDGERGAGSSPGRIRLGMGSGKLFIQGRWT